MVGTAFYMGESMEIERREIPGYPGYYCDREGNIYSDRRCGNTKQRRGSVIKKMATFTKKNGYVAISLLTDVECRSKHHVHRLILLTWAGPPPADRPNCNHKNGVKADNRLQNLEWVSRSENMLHCSRILGKKNGFGEEAYFTKIDDDKVRAIRRMRAETTLTYKKIGEAFGVHETVAMRVAKRQVWGHVE